MLDTGLIEDCVRFQTVRCNDAYLREELVQEIWLWVLTYDEAKLSDAYDNGHLNALVTKTVQNQWYSNHSDFHKRYRRLDRISDEITDEALQVPDGGGDS